MNQFFVESSQISDNHITILSTDVNHIKNVLRMEIGQTIAVSNGIDREYICEIVQIEKDSVNLLIITETRGVRELPSQIYLFQGLPKNDKMELIIQKAVELGVYEIIPVAAKRAVVKLDAKKEQAKRKRWQGISEGAAKQSKRIVIPQIKQVMTFKEALGYSEQLNVKLLPYENKEGMMSTKKAIENIKAGESIGVFIGPEGGFEETEIEMASTMGWVPISLGSRILRTETAGLTALSILMYQLEIQDRQE